MYRNMSKTLEIMSQQKKVSMAWLKEYVTINYENFEPEWATGAWAMFEDLRSLGLIDERRIEWDEEEEEETLEDEDEELEESGQAELALPTEPKEE